jgi:hypothetical protein
MHRSILAAAAAIALAGCVTAPTTSSGFLTDYATLKPVEAEGRAARKEARNADALANVRSVTIAPTIIAESAAEDPAARAALAPIAREIDAQLCQELSERFEIRPEGGDVTVRAAVTQVEKTGVSASVVSAVANQFIPGPGLRLPIGLGGLAAEAEAVLPGGGQVAAIAWARRAQIALDDGSTSQIGDAHRMAEPFADAVAALMTLEGAPKPAAQENACPNAGAGNAGRWAAQRVLGLYFAPGLDQTGEPINSPPPAAAGAP